MKLHLVRHAEAIERTPEVTEEHRYLTAKGRTRLREAMQALGEAGVRPDLIVTSPLVRAVQTAEILAERVRYRGEVLLSSLLASGFGLDDLGRLLAQHPDASELALVGHDPDLSALTSELLGDHLPVHLSKGATISFTLPRRRIEEAEFLLLVTAKGKVFRSRQEALQRVTGSEE